MKKECETDGFPFGFAQNYFGLFFEKDGSV